MVSQSLLAICIPSVETVTYARLVASIVLQITHGSSIENVEDPIVQGVHEVMSNFSRLAAQGAWLVDSFPICACASVSGLRVRMLVS